MRAATVQGFGANAQLVVGETARPAVGPDDVLVRVHASSVNPKDWKINKPLTTLVPPIVGLRPFIIGDDLSGVVVEKGANVRDFKVGDEVYGMDMRLRTSACAEFARIATRRIAIKPANISHREAAVLPLAALTALQSFRLGKLAPGNRVLIIGASGGVGTLAVQIAKALDAEVTAVCSGRNVERVRSLGADHVLDYTAGDYLAGCRDFDTVFDVTSYETPRSCSHALRDGGVFVTSMGNATALATGLLAPITPGAARSAVVRVESYTRDLDTIREMVESGRVRPVIDSEFPLSRINEAYERSRTGRARGKIAIYIDETEEARAAS